MVRMFLPSCISSTTRAAARAARIWARSPLAFTWPFYSFPFYNFPDNMYAGVDANFCSGICQLTEGTANIFTGICQPPEGNRNFPNGILRTKGARNRTRWSHCASKCRTIWITKARRAESKLAGGVSHRRVTKRNPPRRGGGIPSAHQRYRFASSSTGELEAQL